MMYNYSKLLGKIIEVCGNRLIFAQKMCLSERSISLKLNNKRDFKQCEINRACRILGIPKEEISDYFFDLKVQ